MTNINLDVYTCEAFELPNGGTFSPTTSTLITGDTQAVLVDTQYREPDVPEVIRRIEASGKTLTTIFITHGHFDHYFGLEMLLAALSLCTGGGHSVCRRVHRREPQCRA
jgi:glyoxylase-like metal-dependent hydrolase (beta-lactamase superfamily II)